MMVGHYILNIQQLQIVEMGVICQKNQRLQNYPVKQKQPLLGDMNTPITMGSSDLKIIKSISNSQEKCLLLFVDTQCNVRRDQFLEQVKDTVSSKFQDFLDVQLKGKCMNPGDCFIFNIIIQELPFKHAAVLCINVWQAENKSLQDPLQQDIEHALQSIKKKQLNSVCITGFNEQFGIPFDIGYKKLCRAIFAKMDQLNFTSISLICQKQDHLKTLNQIVTKEKKKRQQGMSQSLANSVRSDYY